MCTKSANSYLTSFITAVLLVLTATVTEAESGGLKVNGKIAFSSDRDGNREIYMMNPDGTNQVRLTNNTGVDDSPAWSPDGTKIAFVSQVGPDLSARTIFMMNPDGTNKVEVTTVPNPEWWLRRLL